MRYFTGILIVLCLLAAYSFREKWAPTITRKVTDDGTTPLSAPATNHVRFFALGDTGTGGAGQIAVADMIEQKCAQSGCDFGILLGDNFYPDGVTSEMDPQWQTKFELPYKNINVPFYAVLGNHDYGDGQYLDRAAFQIEYGKKNPKWIMPNDFYFFEKTNALFLALNTEEITRTSTASDQEGEYFSGLLAQKQAQWIFALGHRPYISNGNNGNAGRRLSDFMENHICPRADFYFSGHDHNLQLMGPTKNCKSNLVVSGGGGYELYDLPGNNPSIFQKKTRGFVYVDIDGAKLHLEIINDIGDVEFSKDFLK
jgi:tartrate-resistant acid phosphatase type 5